MVSRSEVFQNEMTAFGLIIAVLFGGLELGYAEKEDKRADRAEARAIAKEKEERRKEIQQAVWEAYTQTIQTSQKQDQTPPEPIDAIEGPFEEGPPLPPEEEFPKLDHAGWL